MQLSCANGCICKLSVQILSHNSLHLRLKKQLLNSKESLSTLTKQFCLSLEFISNKKLFSQ
jgi:hypothetical protein